MNEKQFSPVAGTYHRVRPVLPKEAIAVIKEYRSPLHTVVDLGCGSGLSTLPWKDAAENVIGIDPGDEMLRIAKATESKVSFQKGYGHDTGLPGESVDAVICAQSFHWMEPVSTLREVGRILVPGGVFAAIDYDWPPRSSKTVEDCFSELYATAKNLVRKQQTKEKTFTRYDKTKHLARMKESSVFSFTEEREFFGTEACTSERLYQMALSQSWIDIALRQAPEVMEPLLQNYRKVIEKENGEEFSISFLYRARIGVK